MAIATKLIPLDEAPSKSSSKSKKFATRLVPLDNTEETTDDTSNMSEGTSPQEILKSAAPSNVLKQAGAASVNAPGAMGTLINSLPGIGNPANIMPSVENVAQNPGQIPDAFLRGSQIQSGSPLNEEEKVPAIAGQVAGTAMEVNSQLPYQGGGVEMPGFVKGKPSSPFMAGVKNPETAIPGAFKNAGEELGAAKSLARATDTPEEMSALRMALSKNPEKLAEEAIAATDGSNASLWSQSTSRLLAWRQSLGKMQAEGGQFADDYAKASKAVTKVLTSREPDLMEKMEQMADNFAAKGNKKYNFPWLTFAWNHVVGMAKAVAQSPAIQNTLGAGAGVVAKNLPAISSVASQVTGPSKKDMTSHDLEVRIYQALKSGDHGQLGSLKKKAELNNLNFPQLLKAAQRGYSQEQKSREKGFSFDQIVGPDMANKLRGFGK